MVGGADITYRDRALLAEARVAELEAELAEYRQREIGGRREGEALSAHRQLVDRIRPHLALADQHSASMTARLLEYLVAHPGLVLSKWAILCGIATKDPETYETVRLVDVAICHARKVLRAIGFGDAIVTAWGHGHELRAEQAAALKAWCEGRA